MVILSRTAVFHYSGAQVVAMLYWRLCAVCACFTAMMWRTLSVDFAREARKRFQPFFDVQLPVDCLRHDPTGCLSSSQKLATQPTSPLECNLMLTRIEP